jgi:pimeloyl-ACP methyl ester carboxylesterase
MPLQLAFEATGYGPAVVILHGLFGSSRNWRSIARALAPRHRVVCVDMRNHGRSPAAASMSYREMAADVRVLIESEGLDRPVLVGHSMGGKTAMALALENPGLLGRLVVVDIAPVSYADRFTPYVDAMSSVNPATTADRAEAMRRMSEKIPDAATVAFLMQNLTARDGHFDWLLNLPAIGAAIPALCQFPTELAARRCEIPATLVTGSLSDYVRPADLAAFAGMFPRLRQVEIEGAGHWVHADRPAEFLAALDLPQPATALSAQD